MPASTPPSSKHQSRHQYPAEMRERAVRMVLETIKETGERHGVVTRVGLELGIGSGTLRQWGEEAADGPRLPPGGTAAGRGAGVGTEEENRPRRRAAEQLLTPHAAFSRRHASAGAPR